VELRAQSRRSGGRRLVSVNEVLGRAVGDAHCTGPRFAGEAPYHYKSTRVPPRSSPDDERLVVSTAHCSLSDSAPVHRDLLWFGPVRTVGTNLIRLRIACHPRSMMSLTTVLLIGSLFAATSVDLTAQASVEQTAPITGLGG
jgi:hypothetical protein